MRDNISNTQDRGSWAIYCPSEQGWWNDLDGWGGLNAARTFTDEAVGADTAAGGPHLPQEDAVYVWVGTDHDSDPCERQRTGDGEMSNARDRSCADRIRAERNSRDLDLEVLTKLANGDEDWSDWGDDEQDWREAAAGLLGESLEDLDTWRDVDVSESAQEALDAYGLGVSIRHEIRVEVSTGGPADYLTATIERGRYGWELAGGVVYHFADWFDHAEMPATEAMERWVESIVESMAD